MTPSHTALLRALRILFSSPASTSPQEVPCFPPSGAKGDPRPRSFRGHLGSLRPRSGPCAGDEPTICGQRVASLPGFICVNPPHTDADHFYQDQDDYLDLLRVTS